MGLFRTIVLFVLLGSVGAFMTFVGARWLQTYLRLWRSDPVDIRELDDPSGSVELTGSAELHAETTRSPFMDTESLLLDWSVTERNPSAEEGPNVYDLDSGHAAHPFVLDDGTGSVLIRPAGAGHELQPSTEYEVEGDESPPAGVEEYLAETASVDREHDRPRRYREARLEPGDDAYVYGPVLEAGHSVDLPGGVDAVVGLEDPDDRVFTVGEDDLSSLLTGAASGEDRFLVANRSEPDTRTWLLKKGALWAGIGLVFLATPFLVLVFG